MITDCRGRSPIRSWRSCGSITPTSVRPWREKLQERHGLAIGRETLRLLRREAGLWLPRAQRRKAIQHRIGNTGAYAYVIKPRSRRLDIFHTSTFASLPIGWRKEVAPSTMLLAIHSARPALAFVGFAHGAARAEGFAGFSVRLASFVGAADREAQSQC